MKTLRTFLFPALLLSACLLLSCGDSDIPSADTNTENFSDTEAISDTVETEYRYTPANTDYKQAEFRIINYDNVSINGWSGTPSDLFPAEDPHADVLSEAVYTRNLHVEEQLKGTSKN